MNWTAIIAGAEITGAIAVVVSVLYLARQVRIQTLESRLAATRQLASNRVQSLRDFSGDEGLIELWLRAIRDYDSLQGADRMRASVLFNIVMRNAEQDFIHAGTGHADDPYLESVDRALAANVSSPGVQQWWTTTHQLFNQTFQNHVDELIASSKQSGLSDAFTPSSGVASKAEPGE